MNLRTNDEDFHMIKPKKDDAIEDYLSDHHATADLRRDLVRALVARALDDAKQETTP